MRRGRTRGWGTGGEPKRNNPTRCRKPWLWPWRTKETVGFGWSPEAPCRCVSTIPSKNYHHQQPCRGNDRRSCWGRRLTERFAVMERGGCGDRSAGTRARMRGDIRLKDDGAGSVTLGKLRGSGGRTRIWRESSRTRRHRVTIDVVDSTHRTTSHGWTVKRAQLDGRDHEELKYCPTRLKCQNRHGYNCLLHQLDRRNYQKLTTVTP